jgi:hypothetical protein
MRTYALAIAASTLFALPASHAVGMGSRGVQGEGLHQRRSVGYQDCRELRTACLNKKELREQVHGNCQRYRRMCGLE